MQTPNLQNILLRCRRRTFLCVDTLPISVTDYQVEISSVVNIHHLNYKSKSAFKTNNELHIKKFQLAS